MSGLAILARGMGFLTASPGAVTAAPSSAAPQEPEPAAQHFQGKLQGGESTRAEKHQLLAVGRCWPKILSCALFCAV